MDSLQARQTWELENRIEPLASADVDTIYRYDERIHADVLSQKPWTKDPHYFKNVRISALALLKMVVHARSGDTIEVMGIMQGKVVDGTIIVMDAFGKVVDGTIIVMDAFALPVEGTETRVNAQAEAYEYMVEFTQTNKREGQLENGGAAGERGGVVPLPSGVRAGPLENVVGWAHCKHPFPPTLPAPALFLPLQAGRLENVVGWYHSHPGYGCWLSGIDVSTQMLNQEFQEPFLAVVIDPTRTVSAGKGRAGGTGGESGKGYHVIEPRKYDYLAAQMLNSEFKSPSSLSSSTLPAPCPLEGGCSRAERGRQGSAHGKRECEGYHVMKARELDLLAAQLLNQEFQEPFLAVVVIDPTRSVRWQVYAGKAVRIRQGMEREVRCIREHCMQHIMHFSPHFERFTLSSFRQALPLVPSGDGNVPHEPHRVRTQIVFGRLKNQPFSFCPSPPLVPLGSKVEIGAFRTYPKGYKPPDEPPSEYQTIPLNKIEDFGVHCKQYYSLDITYFKSSLDSHLLDLLWNKYWVNTLSSSQLLANRDYVAGQISDLAGKLERAERRLARSRRIGGPFALNVCSALPPLFSHFALPSSLPAFLPIFPAEKLEQSEGAAGAFRTHWGSLALTEKLEQAEGQLAHSGRIGGFLMPPQRRKEVSGKREGGGVASESVYKGQHSHHCGAAARTHVTVVACTGGVASESVHKVTRDSTRITVEQLHGLVSQVRRTCHAGISSCITGEGRSCHADISTRITVEQLHGLMSQVMKDLLFNSVAAASKPDKVQLQAASSSGGEPMVEA
ncbi:unnamed protein product [Closterium sp. NIES-64]|nr:unnamed protein product [Closterium sp. NIES-64]